MNQASTKIEADGSKTASYKDPSGIEWQARYYEDEGGTVIVRDRETTHDAAQRSAAVGSVWDEPTETDHGIFLRDFDEKQDLTEEAWNALCREIVSWGQHKWHKKA